MRLHPDLEEATFVTRLNRFAALMRREGEDVMVHVANSGRMGELLRPENPMFVAPAPPGSHRKTGYDLALVEVDGVYVSADARLPNLLVQEAFVDHRLPEFAGYDRVTREVALEDSRIDLLLSGAARQCYVEVKSVTLVEDGVGLFPDAPTQRGSKHVLSLQRAVERGDRAAVFFVIQRPDAHSLTPNQAADPRFCRSLSDAVELGVEAYAYRCDVDRRRVALSDSVPVRLG